MRLLIAGGAGFIGSHFVRYLLRRYPSYHIVTLDKLTYAGNRDNLKEVAGHSRHKFVKGDICHRPLVNRLSAKVDAIVNFAAETHVDRAIVRPAPFLRTDLMGTGVLLDAARRFRHARYLQISTDEVYGSVARGRTNEASPLRPRNPYAASKAGADLLVRSYHTTYGLPALITRCCNNYGPYQFPEKLIPLLITNALDGRPLPLYGDGLYRRDWIYVEDHCRALDRVLHHGKDGSVYNIKGGRQDRSLTNLAIARMIVLGVGRTNSAVRFVADRPGHDRRYALEDRAIRRLGFRPVTSFDDGLDRTIRWYRRHRVWWERRRAGRQLEFDWARFTHTSMTIPQKPH